MGYLGFFIFGIIVGIATTVLFDDESLMEEYFKLRIIDEQNKYKMLYKEYCKLLEENYKLKFEKKNYNHIPRID